DSSKTGRARELLHDRPGIALPIGSQRIGVRLEVGEQPSGDGSSGPCQALAGEESVDQCASGAPVAVREGMDRLELRVRDRSMEQDRKVLTSEEGDEIRHRGGYVLRL